MYPKDSELGEFSPHPEDIIKMEAVQPPPPRTFHIIKITSYPLNR